MKSIIPLLTFLFLFIEIYSQNVSTKNLSWRNIGPANMMGRIAAIDASNKVKDKVSLILKSKGGYGCVREFSDLYLSQNI